MLEQWASAAAGWIGSAFAALERPENRAAAFWLAGFAVAAALGLAAAVGAALANARRRRWAAQEELPEPVHGPAAGPLAVRIDVARRCAAEAYAEILWLAPDDAHATAALRRLRGDERTERR